MQQILLVEQDITHWARYYTLSKILHIEQDITTKEVVIFEYQHFMRTRERNFRNFENIFLFSALNRFKKKMKTVVCPLRPTRPPNRLCRISGSSLIPGIRTTGPSEGHFKVLSDDNPYFVECLPLIVTYVPPIIYKIKSIFYFIYLFDLFIYSIYFIYFYLLIICPRNSDCLRRCVARRTLRSLVPFLNVSTHVLNHLLPPVKDIGYNLIPQTHDRCLPGRLSSLQKKNFFNRLLFLDSY